MTRWIRRALLPLVLLTAPLEGQTARDSAVVRAKADTLARVSSAGLSKTNRLLKDLVLLMAKGWQAVAPAPSPAPAPAPVPPPAPAPVPSPPPPPPAPASPPPPAPVPPPPSGAWLSETFADLTSFAGIQGRPWYQVSDYTDASRISVDQTDGAPGGSGRSMRYDFANGAGGVGILMRLPSPVTEYWTEIWAKFSTSFSSTGTCNGNNPDYKFVFWALQPGDGRNEIKVGNFGDMRRLDTRYHFGPDVLAINSTAPINSGQWHRYRAHNKVAGNGGSIFNVEYWDGTNPPQVLKQEGFSLTFSSMDYIVLGANRNCNAAAAMWLKWGKITLYKQNPGWGI